MSRRATVASVLILLATDADEVFDEVDAALASVDDQVMRITEGRAVRDAVLELDPTVVVLDLQIGSMGGVAACIDLRHEEGAGRMAHQRILLLLDRSADTFLAEQSGADSWLVKPLDASRLSRAVDNLLGAPR